MIWTKDLLIKHQKRYQQNPIPNHIIDQTLDALNKLQQGIDKIDVAPTIEPSMEFCVYTETHND
ncbi:MAG: hypothetical protein AAF442_07305 [Pseudomonadota bacterium]